VGEAGIGRNDLTSVQIEVSETEDTGVKHAGCERSGLALSAEKAAGGNRKGVGREKKGKNKWPRPAA
jgi:hypothetical protein